MLASCGSLLSVKRFIPLCRFCWILTAGGAAQGWWWWRSFFKVGFVFCQKAKVTRGIRKTSTPGGETALNYTQKKHFSKWSADLVQKGHSSLLQMFVCCVLSHKERTQVMHKVNPVELSVWAQCGCEHKSKFAVGFYITGYIVSHSFVTSDVYIIYKETTSTTSKDTY